LQQQHAAWSPQTPQEARLLPGLMPWLLLLLATRPMLGLLQQVLLLTGCCWCSVPAVTTRTDLR
jgi:hypothetical protein